jgi:hypothetical protein
MHDVKIPNVHLQSSKRPGGFRFRLVEDRFNRQGAFSRVYLAARRKVRAWCFHTMPIAIRFPHFSHHQIDYLGNRELGSITAGIRNNNRPGGCFESIFGARDYIASAYPRFVNAISSRLEHNSRDAPSRDIPVTARLSIIEFHLSPSPSCEGGILTDPRSREIEIWLPIWLDLVFPENTMIDKLRARSN